jgi:hypothetical protein
MYKLIEAIEFLLQSSFRNPLNFIIIELLCYVLCRMYDVEDWALHYELFNFSSETIIVQTLCICT